MGAAMTAQLHVEIQRTSVRTYEGFLEKVTSEI